MLNNRLWVLMRPMWPLDPLEPSLSDLTGQNLPSLSGVNGGLAPLGSMEILYVAKIIDFGWWVVFTSFLEFVILRNVYICKNRFFHTCAYFAANRVFLRYTPFIVPFSHKNMFKTMPFLPKWSFLTFRWISILENSKIWKFPKFSFLQIFIIHKNIPLQHFTLFNNNIKYTPSYFTPYPYRQQSIMVCDIWVYRVCDIWSNLHVHNTRPLHMSRNHIFCNMWYISM